MNLKDEERIDLVPGTRYKIIQNTKRFSYGIDAVVLSEFTKAKGVVVDLGTGTGIIPIRILGRQRVKKIYGIEIQEEVANMAKRSLEINDIEDIAIVNEDLKNIDKIFTKHSVDVVVSNPPYMVSNGLLNEDENFAISRHEIKCDIYDISGVSNYLLRPLGKIFLIHRPSRLVDIFDAMRKNNIEPKRIQFIKPKEDSVPNLVLIEGVKGGKPELKYEKDLIVYNSDGSYTQEIEEIYNRSCLDGR